jgi:predicted nucleic acid-binding protein
MNEHKSYVLIDSSIWIDFFKGNEKVAFVSNILLADLACTNEVVLTELLPSMRIKKEENLIKLMRQVRKFDMEIDWPQLRNIQSMNLQNGNNKVPLADIMIAQNCIQNDLKLLTTDKHFIKMAEYLPLQIFDGMR